MSNKTVTILSIYNTYIQNHIIKHTIHFDYLWTEKSEAHWFSFAGFLFFGGEGGGGDSWPMTNLAIWCLPDGEITYSFMNHNNCFCTARIICGV
jgi:hypothetical protein